MLPVSFSFNEWLPGEVMARESSKTPNTYEKWRAFVCGHPHQKRGRRVVATLKAFFDDTGTHDDSTIMGIGGCISSIDRWDKFSFEWDEHLTSWDLDWFHMTDAESKAKAYKDWTDEHRDSRVGILSRLVADTVVCSVGTILPHQQFKEKVTVKIAESAPEMTDLQGDPYFVAFAHVFNGIEEACSHLDVSKSDVEIVFAEQKSIGPRTRDAWRESIRDRGFQEPVFRSPKGLPPLQAADMIAWFLQYKFSKKDRPTRSRHKALNHRLLVSPLGPEVMDRLSDGLDEIVERADKIYGPMPAQAKKSGRRK